VQRRAADDPQLATARWLALLLPAALLAGALGSQHIGGLAPCEMCHWQRWPHYFAVAVAALALLARATGLSRPLVFVAAAAIALSGAIGVYHAGVELGIFQGLTACTASGSTATGADLLKEIMSAPLVRCDQVQWSFLGVSMAGWNALLSVTGAAAITWLAARKARA
jgi:disulfide bond formation protein DsbB